MPQIHVSPASDRASSRARIIWMIVVAALAAVLLGQADGVEPGLATSCPRARTGTRTPAASRSRAAFFGHSLLDPVVHGLAEQSPVLR